MTKTQEKLSAYLSNTLGVFLSLHQILEIEQIVNGKRRSVRQNRSTFGIAYKAVAEALTELWGYSVSVDEVHELFKQRFEHILFEYSLEPYNPKEIINRDSGEKEYIMPKLSTANLTTVGMCRYYEAIQHFGATFLGIDIPDPSEIPFTDEGFAK